MLPLPRPAFEDAPFWIGGADGQLLIHRCTACQAWIHPPAPACRVCACQSVEPQPVSGAGVVFTFTVNHQAWTPELAIPYVIAIVALDEAPGLHLSTRLVDVDPADVTIGMRVRVTFEQRGDVWLPLFRPCHGQADA